MPVREGGPAPGWVLRPEVEARLHGTMRDAISAVAGPGSGLSPAGLSPAGLWTDGSGTARQQLRPAVALAVAAIGGRTMDDPGVLPAAAAVELLHGSMLGGGPGAHGDLLVAAAISLASRVGPEAGVLIAETLAHQYSGQALQEKLRYDADAPTHHLMEVARLTSGSLFRAACLLGAMASGSGPELRAAAAGFGMDLGICVQLTDDLLDVTAGDFASGTVTLPIALAIRDCPELGGLLRPGLSQESRARAAGLLRGSRAALAATVATARTYANGAGMRLSPVTSHLDLASQVARWPAAYLDRRLQTEASGRYRWLAAPLVDAFR
jgi:geranylgeranyl pyrophosphate synthase